MFNRAQLTKSLANYGIKLTLSQDIDIISKLSQDGGARLTAPMKLKYTAWNSLKKLPRNAWQATCRCDKIVELLRRKAGERALERLWNQAENLTKKCEKSAKNRLTTEWPMWYDSQAVAKTGRSGREAARWESLKLLKKNLKKLLKNAWQLNIRYDILSGLCEATKLEEIGEVLTDFKNFWKKFWKMLDKHITLC